MNLKTLFYPQSVAVVGASATIGSVGNSVVKNLKEQGYTGKIFPVNPHATELYGMKCFASLAEIGKKVDLIVVAVPAAIVPAILEEAGQLKIKNAVVISSGFKEIGATELEEQIRMISEKYRIALVGPNCLGIINPEIRMNASFAPTMPDLGPVAFVSQSGAICTAVIDYAEKLGVGFSKFVSIGNKAVVDEADVLDYLATDEKTKVIAMYIEQLKRPEKLRAAAEKLMRQENFKPIVVIKAGRTGAGAAASLSHTGALAGNDEAYDALFEQCGIIRAERVSELFRFIQGFANNPLPKGKRVAIITNAGGPGVLTADEAVVSGLKLAELSADTTARLHNFLPPAAAVGNPVDLLGDAKADRYEQAVKIVAEDKNVDGLIVLLTPQTTTEVLKTAEALVTIKHNILKPIDVSFMGEKAVSCGIEMLKNARVAVTNFPEQAARVMSALANFSEMRSEKTEEPFIFSGFNKSKVKAIFAAARKRGQTVFPEAEALEVLRAYGFSLLKFVVVNSKGAAQAEAKKIGGKVVLKIISPDILHKSEADGVMTGVLPKEAGEKFEELMGRVAKKAPQAKLLGALIVEMAPSDGMEMILGASKDPSLGNVIMTGLGGIFVEILKDVSFGVVPIGRKDARRMLEKLKSSKIFAGVRGRPALDMEAMIEGLGRLSQLLLDFPEIKELDINPFLVLPEGRGAYVLDARIVI